MKPTFLFIQTYSPAFLENFYSKNSEVLTKDYSTHQSLLFNELFGTSNFYSLNLKKLGYFAKDIIANDEILQKKWAREKKLKISDFSPPHLAQRFFWLRNLISKISRIYYPVRDFIYKKSWVFQILKAQIQEYRPDILCVLDLNFFPPFFLREIRKYTKMIIGQIACPLPPKEYLSSYDLLISSYPHYVERFRKMGISSEYLKLCFEPKVLETIGFQEKKYQCSFVGAISESKTHSSATRLLEEVARNIKTIDFWGYCVPPLKRSSPIFPKYHGQAWGKEMYQILAQSKIVLNRHISPIAQNYANNARLYEATGMGAMLITDYKENLGEIFKIGQEVETYRTSEELIEKIKYYSHHDSQREKIAQAGQKRTLKDHTYSQRIKELLKIIKKYL